MKRIISLLIALSLNAIAAQNVTIGWDANPPTDGVASYNVYEKTGTTWTKIATVPASQTTYTIANLTAGQHVYAVTAVNLLESDRSNELTIPPAPGAPANLRVIVEVVTP